MSTTHLALLLASATALTVTVFGAESAAGLTAAKPAASPLLAVTTTPPPALPEPGFSARPRAVSEATAAQLSAAVPKFDATLQKKPAEPAVDLREVDKPRNTIIRLPNYVVREEKPPVFKERELRTPKGRLEYAYQRHPGLRLGSFGIFSNDGIAAAMLAEEERLEKKREFEDLVSLMRFTDPAGQENTKREVDRAFLRPADFGR